MHSIWIRGDAHYVLCVLFLCTRLPPLLVSQSVSQSGSDSPGASSRSKSRPETIPGTSLYSCGVWIASCSSDLPVAARKEKVNRKRVCAWMKKTSLLREMSAVSPELVPIGEPSRAEAEADSQQAAGILQPQTVFVILDSAETLNLVRWVC